MRRQPGVATRGRGDGNDVGAFPLLQRTWGSVRWRAMTHPHRSYRWIRIWLWTGAFLTLAILVIGGITRLTQSGLSIVEWAPLVGVIPPLNEAQWEDAFAAYRQHEEYRQLRPDMSLAEYKSIFYWEYLHRLVARGIGLVFLVPFAWFWMRGVLSRRLLLALLGLLGLGALQGGMGWLMVASGLADEPTVDHVRLALHLGLAFLIFGTCVWLAAALGAKRSLGARPPWVRPVALSVGVLLAIQVAYGAFVAGLDAGYAFNTFPTMAGGWWPPSPWRLEPVLANLIDNLATVQWIHRWLAFVLLGAAAGAFLAHMVRGVDEVATAWSGVVLALLAVQAVVGILTLVWFVPIPLAVAHQAIALLIFGGWVLWWHRLSGSPDLRPEVGVRSRQGSRAGA